MHKFLFILFLLCSFLVNGQENCNNGIDDDGDGKVDLNDSDCVCNNMTHTIIPNPSFEAHSGCPTNFSFPGFDQLSLATPWIQATNATTDYLNTCGFVTPAVKTKGLDIFPDGNGAAAIFILKNSKEYIGTELLSPMTSGKNYQLTFNVAALNVMGSGALSPTDISIYDPIELTIYGCTDGSNLPLDAYDSPNLADPTWLEIGHATYSPISSWGEVTITFTPEFDVNAIMLGAPDTLPLNYPDIHDLLNGTLDAGPYFIIDNLLLNEASAFGVNILQSGNFCNNNLVLKANITNSANLSTAYQWYRNGIAINGATHSTYNVPSNANGLGQYSVKIVDGNSCIVSSKITINNLVDVSPVFTTTQPNCSNNTGSIIITTPASKYSFDNGSSWVSSNTITNLPAGTYYIKIKNSNGCVSFSSTVIINNIAIPTTPTFTTTQPNCSNNTGSITITTPASEYSFDDGLTWITSANSGNLNPDTYLIKVKNTNGCVSVSSSVIIIHFSNFPPTSTTPQTFCLQQNATINNIQINGQNIKWYDSQTGGNIIPTSTLLQDGAIYYASQTPNTCESSRVPVTVHIQDTVAPTGSNQQTLCAAQNPTLNDIITNGTGIKWYDLSNSATPLPSTTLAVDGTIYYLSQTINGCESVNRLAVSLSLIASLNANDYSDIICDKESNGTEKVDLSNFNTFLQSSSGNIFTYYASLNGAENKIQTEQLNTSHILYSGSNTIYVRIDSNTGCYPVVRLLLTLVNDPIGIPDNVILCEKSGIMVNAGPGFESYLWSNGQKKQINFISQPGNYSVTVTKNHSTTSCATTKNFTVSLSNPATITSIETEDWTDNQNKIIVNTIGLGDYEFSLDNTNYQDSNIFTGLASGNYTVYVKDKNKCGLTTKSPIYLLIYPKFFTPNNDGFHDNWHVEFSQFEENFEVQIFDRFGKLIKSMNNLEAWDGTYNGNVMPSDDYWFYVTRNDGQIYKGHFALKR